MNTELPKLLEERLQKIFSKDELKIAHEWFSLEKRPVFFRVNLMKSSAWEIQDELEKHNVQYEKHLSLPYCYFLKNGIERDLWNLEIYKQGKIYIQSFSSQIPVHFMDLKGWMNALDLTSAPWGKTSQISERVWKYWKVVACEFSTIRREKMQYNLKKLWCDNVEVVWIDALELPQKYPEESFDVILFDAPCSGEWSLSLAHQKFLNDWDIKYIRKNYERQKNIIEKNISLLRKWWVFVYSTCTLAPEENEGIVHYILCNFPELEIQKIDFDYQYKKTPLRSFEKYIYKNDVQKAMRIIPNTESEWFFVAKFKKN